MIRKIVLLFASMLSLVFVTACMNLKPVSSQSLSFTLGPVSMEGVQEELPAATEVIYIIRPQVPTYLDSTRLSYRSASGQVKNIPGTRWAEPLSEGIARAMSLYLSETDLGIVDGYYPWPNASVKASHLSLEFQRFGATESGEVQVAVRWKLKDSAGNSKSGQFVSKALSWEVGQAEDLVEAYNNALEALAQDIAEKLNK